MAPTPIKTVSFLAWRGLRHLMGEKGSYMLTGQELKALIEKRQKELSQKGESRNKNDHTKPCSHNFDYTSVTQGSKEGLALILDEISGK